MNHSLACVLLLAALGQCAPRSATTAPSTGQRRAAACNSSTTVWPNCTSFANGDPWISQHHQELREMHPRILALNFVNSSLSSTFSAEVDRTAAGIREGSRYHGYADPSAPAFLQPEVAYKIDLTDHGSPPAGWTHLNSTHWPIKCLQNAPYQFDYTRLFSPEYTALYDIHDPDDASRVLSLKELVTRGLVHEVWLFVDGGDKDNPAPGGDEHHPDPYQCPNGVTMNDFQVNEVIEYKQKYDANNVPLAGQFETHAGNEGIHDSDLPVFRDLGRSLRILYINARRGAGCGLHSLGHNFEALGFNSDVLPYLKANFTHFANFDLDKRLGASFPHWYACAPIKGRDLQQFDYPCVNTVAWECSNQSPGNGTFDPFNQGCGSVHYPPNARYGYDDGNTAEVQTTCEHYGLKDGDGGKDATDLYKAAKALQYEGRFGGLSCQGGWMVYWRQNFPGLDNKATGVDGKPMLNWWPFLYY